MEHELKTLTARLLAQRWLPRSDRLVRRALVDETFRLVLGRRLADDEPDHRLADLLTNDLGRLFLGAAADLADQHDALDR